MLELFPHSLELHGGDARELPLLLGELPQLRLGARDLALEVAVLLGRSLDLALVDQALRLAQGVELVLGVGDGLVQQLLLLREQRQVLRVELQERRDALQFRLGLFDGAVDALQGISQLGRVTADLDGDPFYVLCDARSPPSGLCDPKSSRRRERSEPLIEVCSRR